MANSVAALTVAWASLLMGSSVVHKLLEDTSLPDGMCWAIVTATTLGYGDLSPDTAAGKALTAFLISVTVFFLIPAITANLASKLIVDRNAFTHEEQEEVKTAVQEILRRLDAR